MEIRQWTVTDKELADEYEAEVKAQMEGKAPLEILPQEAYVTEAARECLRLGINIPAYKKALKEYLNSVQVADLLTGEHHSVAIHWAVYDMLENWVKAEFPKNRLTRWPWGNWWVVHLRYYNPVAQVLEKTEVALVVK